MEIDAADLPDIHADLEVQATLTPVSDTFEKAEDLAAAAVEWALAQLSDDPRLAPLARGAEGLPLHVLARDTLAFVTEHLDSENDGAPGDGPDDRNPSRAQLLKVRAALEFAYARSLDAALAEPDAALAGASAAPYFEPALRSSVAADLDKILPLLSKATNRLASLELLAAATERHLEAGVDNSKHRDWLRAQQARLLEFAGELREVHASAQKLAVDLTFDGARRRALPHPPLHGLSRREQQRALLADALLLHETFGLTEAEIGAIWGDNPPEHAEAKRLGGKVLARARRIREAKGATAQPKGT